MTVSIERGSSGNSNYMGFDKERTQSLIVNFVAYLLYSYNSHGLLHYFTENGLPSNFQQSPVALEILDNTVVIP